MSLAEPKQAALATAVEMLRGGAPVAEFYQVMFAAQVAQSRRPLVMALFLEQLVPMSNAIQHFQLHRQSSRSPAPPHSSNNSF